MAALILGFAGEAIGSALFGSTAFTLFGTAISGAALGGAIGSAAGSIIDSALFAPTLKQKGPRLSDLNILTSTEGAPIPRVDGYMRLSGQLIWATKYKETESTTTTGGKGGSPKVKTTTYTYSISIAVALCEGKVHKLGRIWADGNLLDLSKFTIRFYPGDETQGPDPLIEEIEGTGNTPSYRGTAYVVFEDMDLTAFGNRIPQLQFEIVRSITADRPDSLENMVRGLCLIPGAGEFVYATDIVTVDNGQGTTSPENKNNSDGIADSLSSLDDLQGVAPNVQTISVVVGWFGDDLRAGNCLVKPRVETADKTTYPANWKVNGISRSEATVVSQINGRPAYGGTPSDDSVVQIIQDIKSRGWRVTFYPFLFMDVPAGNTLADPYSDNASVTGQPAYPWRGRITCSPAAGYAGSVDKTSAAATQIASFFGSASPSDFTVNGTTVSWSGGDDWGWRRCVLHYAHLCAAAGGVDAFLIGSELRGLTRTRSGATAYPAVSALQSLAADVKSILGSGTKVGYAADWSEYNNHQTGDAPGAVLFNLDPLWADSNIDFVGVDNYMPLSDWRDGTAHLDFQVSQSIYKRSYLQANIRGGEDYDWYYSSAGATGNEPSADRISQTRTPITDGLGKPWVFRQKDFWNWWSNRHYDRPDGSESSSHTSWVPESKPIWITEIGCPAVNKGSNQPNVFFDPKSSESFLPYFSNGYRDDLIQRAFLEAHLNYWSDDANNPDSSVYDGKMIDTANISLWCWDARPYPFFPQRIDLWSDGPNYDLGHWLNGRLGAVLLPDLVSEICNQSSFSDYDVSDLFGIVTGYARTATMSARDEIASLAAAYFFDGVESDGTLKFIMRGRSSATEIGEDDLVVDESGDVGFSYSFARAQDDDLPAASRITFIDPGNNYQQGVWESKKLLGNSNRVAESQLPLVMDRAQATAIGDKLIQEAWLARETGNFSLAPYYLILDPTDEVSITAGGRTRRMRVMQIDDTASRAVQTVACDPSIYDAYSGPASDDHPSLLPASPGRAIAVFADLPMLTDDDVPQAPHVGAFANPWPGEVLIYRSATASGYALDTTIANAAWLGETTADFYSGPVWRWDRVGSLYVKLYNGTLASADELSVLNGANALAVQNADGEWEIVQFATAELISAGQWKLTGLLRGQRGTESAMRDPVAAGARVLVLNGLVEQLGLSLSEFALTWNYLWGPSGVAQSDPAWQGATYTFKGAGLRPFAPCRLSAVFADNGADIKLSFIRRDRSPDALVWEQNEIPMSEANESYEIDIYNGDNVVRTIAATSSPVTYTAAQQAADFGAGLGNGSTLKLAAYQLSQKVGRGPGASKTFFF